MRSNKIIFLNNYFLEKYFFNNSLSSILEMSPLSYTKYINILVFNFCFLYASIYFNLFVYQAILPHIIVFYYTILDTAVLWAMICKFPYFLKPFKNQIEILDSLPRKMQICTYTKLFSFSLLQLPIPETYIRVSFLHIIHEFNS